MTNGLLKTRASKDELHELAINTSTPMNTDNYRTFLDFYHKSS
jgi:hypothetical protein